MINNGQKNNNMNKIFHPMENKIFHNFQEINNKKYQDYLYNISYSKTDLINNYYVDLHCNEIKPNIINFQSNADSANYPTPKKPNLTELEEKPQKAEQPITKFFTDYGGYGYKCSCSKTQCNRYYCECFRSGLFCIDCNCKNCQNKPPENYVSNRRPSLSQSKAKVEIVICTCTKSGCNKKYCECYKNGTKCHSGCRCVGCENSENGKKMGEVYFCCPANSIYIVKNELVVENICEEEDNEGKNNGKVLEKKRRRDIL